ncbi:hypothetical protein QTP70_001783 [Hemibagrus guttatus]|uniref:Gypsy retrotransposon integrase-like protein 1 n=1 Tax=Hemibagrus guttatus TaxID=175788 RepID=A0AAE0V9M1_9TELE|nr:hypothetical protein QTP70_001783 [Hemibagrus guttatus]
MPEEPEPILPPNLFVCPITWSLNDDICAATEEEPAPPGGPDGKAYVPTSLCLSLLDSVHASPGSGHPGRQQTLSLLKEQYWWPNMAEDVARFVRGCSVCAMVSTSRRLPEGKLVPLSIPCRSWSHLGIDFATDLPVSNGFTTILVTVDHFSKACKLILLKGLPTALETAEALFSNIFRHFGIPEDIVSDRGPQFISRVWRGFFKLLGVSVSLSSGYHPQTGQTERKIQEIGCYLRAYCHDHQHDWSQYLPWAEYAENSLRQESTKLPFQCILGYQPPLCPWSAEPSEAPTVDHWFRESERVWESAHVHLQRTVRRQKVKADVHHRDAPLYHTGLALHPRHPPPAPLQEAEPSARNLPLSHQYPLGIFAWETTAEVVRETGRKVLGVSSGRRKEDKETWWWNEEVQDSIQRKRLAKKKWDMDRTEKNRQEYKELQCRVKREVSKAKQKAYDEFYTRLDTREGEKDLYRLARQRDRDGKDVQQVRVIKDRDGRVLTSEECTEKMEGIL